MSTTTSSQGMQVLGELVLVQLDIRGSSFESKLDRETDLKGVKMPPKSAVSAGVKRYASPELRRPFDKLAKRAERVCREAGFPLLGGWAIPPERANEVHADLDALAGQYGSEVQSLHARWDQVVQDWEDLPEHQEILPMLRRGRPDADAIRHRYRFTHTMYRVKSATDAQGDAINTGITRQGENIAEALLDDAAKTAEAILKKSFGSKSVINRRALRSVVALADKLRSFAMVDPVIYPVASIMAECLTSVPPTGLLSVIETTAIRGLLEMLTDPEKVRKAGHDALAASESTADADNEDEVVEADVEPAPAPAAPAPKPAPKPKPSPIAQPHRPAPSAPRAPRPSLAL